MRRARAALAANVRDVQEFLDELGVVAKAGPVELTATYHDACHLAHAQKIREAPRRLLATIPGLKLVPLPESEICCGAAGTYNLTQPEMSRRLLASWQYWGVMRQLHWMYPEHVAQAVVAVVTAPPGTHFDVLEVLPENPKRGPL